MASNFPTIISDDQGLLRYEPKLDDTTPRVDKAGKVLNSWKGFHELAVIEIIRWLRARKDVWQRFDWACVGLRSREGLAEVACCLALYFLYNAANVQAANGYLQSKRDYYYSRALDLFEQETQMIDYDQNYSGKIEDGEQNQPMPSRFIRG